MGRPRQNTDGDNHTERTKLETWLSKHSDSRTFKELTELINLGDKQKLDDKLLELAKYAQGIENMKKIDEKLIAAKQAIKDANFLYKEDKLACQKKSRLIALAISERFGDAVMDMKPTGQS